MKSPEARAAARRNTWSHGVSRSFAEAEAHDIEFWRKATPQQRLDGLFDLVEMMHDAVEPILAGSPHGTRQG